MFHLILISGTTMSIVKVDEKGRAIIRKRLLKAAGIETPCTVLATIKGEGLIELKVISDNLTRAEKIAAQKLRGWREEEHKGEKLLNEMMLHEVVGHSRARRSSEPQR